MKNENKKRGEAAAKQNPQRNGAKYKRLSRAEIEAVVEDAADAVYSLDLGERIGDEAEVEEHEDNPGTWFVSFRAETWREAAAFSAAVVGAAFSRGLYADVSAGWETGLECEGGGRLVDVFVAAADFMTDDGKPAVDAAESEGGRGMMLTGLAMALDERPEDMTSAEMLKRLRKIVGVYEIQAEVWRGSCARENALAGHEGKGISHMVGAAYKSGQIGAATQILGELAKAFGLDVRECAAGESDLRAKLADYGILKTGGAE